MKSNEKEVLQQAKVWASWGTLCVSPVNANNKNSVSYCTYFRFGGRILRSRNRRKPAEKVSWNHGKRSKDSQTPLQVWTITEILQLLKQKKIVALSTKSSWSMRITCPELISQLLAADCAIRDIQLKSPGFCFIWTESCTTRIWKASHSTPWRVNIKFK